jgi:hypothetical protein
LFFGRDYLGRRSLVCHFPEHEGDVFWVSSVGTLNEEIGNSSRESGSNPKDDEADGNGKKDHVNGKSAVKVARGREEEGEEDEGDADGYWKEVLADGLYSVCLADVDFSSQEVGHYQDS